MTNKSQWSQSVDNEIRNLELTIQRVDNETQRTDNKAQCIDNETQCIQIMSHCVGNEMQCIENTLTMHCNAFSMANTFTVFTYVIDYGDEATKLHDIREVKDYKIRGRAWKSSSPERVWNCGK